MVADEIKINLKKYNLFIAVLVLLVLVLPTTWIVQYRLKQLVRVLQQYPIS